MFLTKLGRVGLFRTVPRSVQLSSPFSNEGYSSSDDERKKKSPRKQNTAKIDEKTPETQASAANKLNSLLASMNTEGSLSTLSRTVSIPLAGGRKQKRAKTDPKPEPDSANKPKDIVEAVKQVADLTGEQSKQTEAELLSKVLGHIDNESGAAVKPPLGEGQSLSDLIVSMKIDRTPKKQPILNRAEIVRQSIATRRAHRGEERDGEDFRYKRSSRPRSFQPIGQREKIDLFGDRLGIFTEPDKLKDSPDILPTWNRIHQRELKMAVTHPPRNYYEKMIVWTEQGKIWKFPIDNEQGLDEEAHVDFTEHIFLEQHLEGWCPERGPVRHFMELVCVGLSKNPYVTAQEKKEHIFWYRDYFESKKDILKQVIIDQKGSEKGETAKEIEK